MALSAKPVFVSFGWRLLGAPPCQEYGRFSHGLFAVDRSARKFSATGKVNVFIPSLHHRQNREIV
jgi:hypothetical protein